ncbi:3D (Asp-Asp-Asp) domain-containing protein [Lachnospiraceae bacterium]|nr:3D (Asp-Asp-Asp) domain-containing protein [Lachnospiraceae bacterium]
MKHIRLRFVAALLTSIMIFGLECPTLNINADEPVRINEDLSPIHSELKIILNYNNIKKAESLECSKRIAFEYAAKDMQAQQRINEENAALQQYLPQKTYIGSYELTAYIATGNPCASGVYPTVGHTVACNSLPMGTHIYIEGCGEYVVEDTGGMADNVIDIFVSDYDTAIEFGRQIADVYVLE